MASFVCDNCECIENTALGNYNYKNDNEKALCSECLTGEWHGSFKKQKYNPKKHKVLNRKEQDNDNG